MKVNVWNSVLWDLINLDLVDLIADVKTHRHPSLVQLWQIAAKSVILIDHNV